MVIGEMKRLQVLAGIIDQYDEYFPNTEHIKLTESELQEFNEQWALLEKDLQKDDKEINIPVKLDKRTIEIAKVVILKFQTVNKKAKAFAKLLGKGGEKAQAILYAVWGLLGHFWRNKMAYGIAAAVSISYQALIGALNWVSESAPRLVQGIEWLFNDVEIPDGKLGTALDQLTREKIQTAYTGLINRARNYEGEWTWEILGDMFATVLEGIGAAFPYFIDWSVMLVTHFKENGFGWLGSITGVVLLWAVLKGFWDLAMKIVSPVGNYIKKWIASQNIVIDIEEKVKDIEEPAGPPKVINPGGPISKDDAVKSISKPKPEIPGFKKSDDEPEVGVVKPEPK